MPKSRVWIHYTPQLYSDLFKRIIQSNGLGEVLETNPLEEWQYPEPDQEFKKVDLVIYSLDLDSQLEMVRLADRLPEAKFVAFSLSGDYGLRRNPGEVDWEELRPFGVQQMLSEVSATGNKINP